jgi:hypothetical protein
VYKRRQHDYGVKTFLGREGAFDGWQILDIIFEQPCTAEFICTKLWHYFVSDTADAETIRELAATLRESGYELKPVLKRLFRSQIFYSPEVMGAQIKSPAQFVVQLAHDLRLEAPPFRTMTRASAQLGQNLFYPPNVKGWDGGKAWINANALLTRYNLPNALILASLAADEAADEQAMMTSMQADDAEMNALAKANKSKTLQELSREEYAAIIQLLPAADQKELRKRLQALRGQPARQRFETVRQFLLERDLNGIWNPAPIFAELRFTTAGECADALAQYMLNRTLEGEQRRILLEALGAPNTPEAPLALEDIRPSHMISAVHLLMSAAEYQLC